MFLHATFTPQGIEFSHIFFNMFAVYMFGRTVETVWGPKRFLVYYLATGIGAGIIQECVWFFSLPPMYSEYALTVGASGAVFGILLAFGMLFPNAPLFIMLIPIPVKAKYCVMAYGLIELYAGVVHHGGDNVAHFAHLGGMLFGIILILYWKKKGQWYGKSYE
jgi:membrane associated rhomboid family serine protease